MAEKHDCSDKVKEKVGIFGQSDAAFKAAWDSFEQRHATELAQLEKLREERNAKLDDARRALREEAVEADITRVKEIRIGPFVVNKKWHAFYIPEKLAAKLESRDLYDTATSKNVVAEKIEIAKYDVVKQFLQDLGLVKEFEDCEDGQELTPAITGPKPISPFGAEYKDAK